MKIAHFAAKSERFQFVTSQDLFFQFVICLGFTSENPASGST
jgi:hypothetical protein